MDKSIERYRERRDARLKKRLDDEWITIKGTHVMVDDDKKITKGPENLKKMSSGSNKAIPAKNLSAKESTPLRNGSRTVSSKKGSGEAPSTGVKETNGEYEKIPYRARAAGGKYATPEENKQRRETISRFMKEAQTGDVYKVGGGVGSSGAEFKVIERGDGKKYLQWKSDGYSKPVLMNRANVESYIANGAKKVADGGSGEGKEVSNGSRVVSEAKGSEGSGSGVAKKYESKLVDASPTMAVHYLSDAVSNPNVSKEEYKKIFDGYCERNNIGSAKKRSLKTDVDREVYRRKNISAEKKEEAERAVSDLASKIVDAEENGAYQYIQKAKNVPNVSPDQIEKVFQSYCEYNNVSGRKENSLRKKWGL